MADYRKLPDPADVNVENPDHVRHWCERWGCSERELRRAVKSTASEMAVTVEAYLDSNGHKRSR